MASVFNSSVEKDFIHEGKGKDGKPVVYRLTHNKVTEVPDEVIAAIRKDIPQRDSDKLIEGDKKIARARASERARLNAETARADAAEKVNGELKARIESLEKILSGKKGAA